MFLRANKAKGTTGVAIRIETTKVREKDNPNMVSMIGDKWIMCRGILGRVKPHVLNFLEVSKGIRVWCLARAIVNVIFDLVRTGVLCSRTI